MLTENEIREIAIEHLRSNYGSLENDDTERMINMFIDGYSYCLNNNNVGMYNNSDLELSHLLERLRICSEIKYPDRLWNAEFLHNLKLRWRNNIKELKSRVFEFEKEINTK